MVVIQSLVVKTVNRSWGTSRRFCPSSRSSSVPQVCAPTGEAQPSSGTDTSSPRRRSGQSHSADAPMCCLPSPLPCARRGRGNIVARAISHPRTESGRAGGRAGAAPCHACLSLPELSRCCCSTDRESSHQSGKLLEWGEAALRNEISAHLARGTESLWLPSSE